MYTEMKRKDYKKPTMLVVELHQPHLMVESQVQTRRTGLKNYTWHDYDDDDFEEE